MCAWVLFFNKILHEVSKLDVPDFELSHHCLKTQLVLIGSPPSTTD